MFRKEALARMSSPDQLDQLLQVTAPRGWVALGGLGLLLLMGILWGVFGTVSTTVEGQGVLIRPGGVRSVVCPAEGVITSVLVHVGDTIYKDREVVQFLRSDNSTDPSMSFITSNCSARVLEILVREGSTVQKGAVLLILEPTDDRLEALLYVPARDGQHVRPGMKVEITPATVKWSEYGYLVGEVMQAEKFPSSREGMMRHLENEELVRSLIAAGPCVRVTAKLERDERTPSGYQWSSSRGPDLEMHNGTPCRARITVRKQSPFSLLIPAVRDLMGI